jgi:predicted MPP superfamily phosphohydrolase
LFRTIAITVWTIFHIYGFWRIATLPAVRRLIPWYIMVVVAVLLWSSFLAPRFFDDLLPTSVAAKIEIIGDQWLGIIFLLFCTLLVADLITGFGLLMKQQAPLIRTLGLVAGVVLSVIAFVQGMRAPVVNHYEVTVEELPQQADGLTIAVLSDLHIGATLGKDWLSDRVRQVNAMQPDAIVILGDIIEGFSALEGVPNMKSAFADLRAPLGVWAVLGNHDHHGGHNSTSALLEDAGIDVLRNEWKELRPGLVIAGIDDGGFGHGAGERARRIRQTLNDYPADAATILLSHRPEAISEAAQAKVDLMLSGHTHGGQIWPFSYVVRSLNPILEGQHEHKGMKIVVSRGTGTWGPRMRLWKPGEILVITLRAT